METLVQDLRFGVRILMRDPAAAPIMVSSLTLSLVEGLWVRSRPFGGLVGRLVKLKGQSPILLEIAPPCFNGPERLSSTAVCYPVEICRDRSGGVCRLLRFERDRERPP